jgi:hypothetical protein
MLAHTKRIATVGIVLLGVLAAMGLSSVHSAEAKMRTWTDAKGKFRITAKFLSLENGVVTLEKEDGSELEIELKKLSTADQKFATEAAKKSDDDNPFKSKEDGPFKGKPKPGSKGKLAKKATDDDDSGNSAEPKVLKVDLSSAEQIALGGTGEWRIEVPQPPESAAFKAKSAPLPPKSNFFEGVKGVAINLTAKKAAVGFVLAEPRPAGTSRVVICDLATGKSGTVATAPGQLAPLALHDDGRQIVMRREEFGFGNIDRLEVWTLKGNKVARQTVWTPYEDVQGGPRDVLWAEFVDAETLATSSRGGKIVLWKFPEIEPLAVLSHGVDGTSPALSPDRKLLAFCTGKELGIVDLARREVIAQQALPQTLVWPNLAFSPTGKKLACISRDSLIVWDVATGKLERTIPPVAINAHAQIDYPWEGYVLAGGKYLVDVENQLKLWTYDGPEKVRSAGDWTFFATTDGEKNPGSLVAARIPQPAALDLLKKALNDPALFVLKSGTTVKINVSGIRDASQQGRVQEALARRLKTIGCQAGANGTIELVATIDGPKERTVSFFGSGDYKMQEYYSKAQFVYQGQPAWETGSTNVPGIVTLKQGENIGTVLKAREKPDYDFFDRVELPKFLQKPAAGAGPGRSLTLGQSQVTTTGIR